MLLSVLNSSNVHSESVACMEPSASEHACSCPCFVWPCVQKNSFDEVHVCSQNLLWRQSNQQGTKWKGNEYGNKKPEGKGTLLRSSRKKKVNKNEQNRRALTGFICLRTEASCGLVRTRQGIFCVRKIRDILDYQTNHELPKSSLKVKLWIKPVFMKTRQFFFWKFVVIVFPVKWENWLGTCTSIFLCASEQHMTSSSYFYTSTAVTMGVAILTQIVLDLNGQQLSPPLLGKFVICRMTSPGLSSNMWIVDAYYCFAACYECCSR